MLIYKHRDVNLGLSWTAVMLIKGKNNFHAHYWLEQFRERGDSERRAMTIVAQWLEFHRTVEAFELAATCIEARGNRSDLAILNAEWLPSNDRAILEIIENTRFSVYRRSLV